MFAPDLRRDKPPGFSPRGPQADTSTPLHRDNPTRLVAMELPNDNPAPKRSQPKISDQEIERILQQAESLANEIVDEVDMKRPVDAVGTSATGQLGAIEPDPLAAVELVEQDLAQLEESLQPQDALALPTSWTELSPFKNKDAPPSIAQLPANRVHAGSQTRAAVPPAEEPIDARIHTKRPTGSPPIEQDLEPQTESAVSLPALLDTAPADAARKASRLTAGRAFREMAVAIPNALMNTVVLLDRPFARLSPSAKQIVAVVGFISLVMGLTAMFVPRMIENNPYAQMEPLPNPAVAGDEHGESGTKHSESAGAEPSTHTAEEKPASHH